MKNYAEATRLPQRWPRWPGSLFVYYLMMEEEERNGKGKLQGMQRFRIIIQTMKPGLSASCSLGIHVTKKQWAFGNASLQYSPCILAEKNAMSS